MQLGNAERLQDDKSIARYTKEIAEAEQIIRVADDQLASILAAIDDVATQLREW